MLLLKCLVKDFKMISKKLTNLLVGHFGPPTIIFSFTSSGSEMVVRSLFCCLIAFSKIFDLCDIFLRILYSYLFIF